MKYRSDTSLARKYVNHGQKTFITLAPGVQRYKSFYGRNLPFFRNKLECLYLDGLSSLVECL